MKKTTYLQAILLTLVMLVSIRSHATERPVQQVTFNDFLQLVIQNNLEFIIERYEVTAAEAALRASKVFQDPELEIILPTFDGDEFGGMPSNIAFEMEVPIELFGKRRNRIRQAQAELYAAQAGLDDFMRYLRADAAFVFADALTKQLILERMSLELTQLNELMEINRALFEVGEIGEVELIQTRLEARSFTADLFDVRAGFSELLSEIFYLIGGMPSDSLVFVGEMNLRPPALTFDDLRRQALENRPDLRMAQHEQEAARHAMQLARSERFPDISLVAGYHNEEALRPGPGVRAAYAGVIIPLQFSGFNRGSYLESRARYEQSEQIYRSTVLTADVEMRNAWEQLQLLSGKRMLFTESILNDAERVRDAVVFSYQRGEVSLLEVFEAQRTLNEIYLNYYETLNQHSHSAIELSRSTGEWFVEF